MTENKNIIEQNENQEQQIRATHGVSSVNAKSSPASKQKNFFLFAGLVLIVGLIVGYYALSAQKKSEEVSETPKSSESVGMTSTRTFTLPPLSSLEVEEPPKPETNEEKVETPEPESRPTVIRTPEKPPEPTLSERRFSAPMMGDDKTINNDSASGKGLAQTLEDEGYIRRDGGRLGALMSSMDTPATKAKLMGDRTLLLPKGTYIDCVLETKLDTTVPGMTSCVIPRNIYSANGKVLLVERGSKAIGEYKGAVENGLNRIFVLWTQIQTPNGVKVALDSPGTDSLGGSGLSGDVDFHWWARFGNALLFSLIQDGFDFAISKSTEGSDGVNYYQNSEDGMSDIIQEAMRQSGNIPPTLTKNQGERIGIFVARDIDFSNVYGLKPTE